MMNNHCHPARPPAPSRPEKTPAASRPETHGATSMPEMMIAVRVASSRRVYQQLVMYIAYDGVSG